VRGKQQSVSVFYIISIVFSGRKSEKEFYKYLKRVDFLYVDDIIIHIMKGDVGV